MGEGGERGSGWLAGWRWRAGERFPPLPPLPSPAAASCNRQADACAACLPVLIALPADTNGHGTHVVGTLVARPYNASVSTDTSDYIGMAPDAKVAFIGEGQPGGWGTISMGGEPT